MNLSQRIVLGAGALAVLLMILFPPTYYYGYSRTGSEIKVFSGYQFIGNMEITGREPSDALTPMQEYRMGLRAEEPIREVLDSLEVQALVEKLLSENKGRQTFDIAIRSVLNPEAKPIASIFHIEPVRLLFQLIGMVLIVAMVALAFANQSADKLESEKVPSLND